MYIHSVSTHSMGMHGRAADRRGQRESFNVSYSTVDGDINMNLRLSLDHAHLYRCTLPAAQNRENARDG